MQNVRLYLIVCTLIATCHDFNSLNKKEHRVLHHMQFTKLCQEQIIHF